MKIWPLLILFGFDFSGCAGIRKNNRGEKALANEEDGISQGTIPNENVTGDSGAAQEDVSDEKNDLTVPAMSGVEVESDADTGTVIAGNDVSGIIYGNGGELITWQKNPWFFTDIRKSRVVTYCIEHDMNQFSLEKAEAQRQIRDALEEWGQFFRLLYPKALASYSSQEEKDFFSSQWYALDFDEVDCSSSGRDKIDLVFELGVTLPEIEKIRDRNKDDLVAFSYLDKYTLKDLWGHGGIWFTPDKGENIYSQSSWPNFWKDREIFLQVLYHELGHVFGLPHDSLTFMDKDQPANLVGKNKYKTFNDSLLKDIVLNNIFYWDDRTCFKPSLSFFGNTNANIFDNQIDQIFGVKKGNLYQLCFENSLDSAQTILTILSTGFGGENIGEITFEFPTERKVSNRYFVELYVDQNKTLKPLQLGYEMSMSGTTNVLSKSLFLMLTKKNIFSNFEFIVVESKYLNFEFVTKPYDYFLYPIIDER